MQHTRGVLQVDPSSINAEGRRILVGSARACRTQVNVDDAMRTVGVTSLRSRPAITRDAIVPRLKTDIVPVNHRSAARTAMPDLQLGIWVDESVASGPTLVNG